MKKTLLLSTLTAGLLFSTTMLQAKTDTKTLVKQQITQTQKNFKKAPKEIEEALKASSLAMQSLQHKKVDEAKKQFKIATEKFDLTLKNDPTLNIVPLDERIAVFENLASVKEIKHILTSTQELLSQYKLNKARASLTPLKDEMDIETVSLPMKVFPIATKDALKALNKGDTKGAMVIMAEAYNTFLIENAVIPLPLLKAQDLIADASSLDKNKKEEATKLLDGAKEELERANVLGYTNKHSPEYKALLDSIDAIKKEIKGKNVVEKLYDKLKEDFVSLVHKNKAEKAEKNVNKYEQKEAIKARKETGKFLNEAKKDESKTIK